MDRNNRDDIIVNYRIPATLLILCGGYSSRFGTDKGLFVANAKDKPMFLRAIEVLGDTCAKVMVVVRDGEQAELYHQSLLLHKEQFTHIDIDIITDDESKEGGLASTAALIGVYSALKKAKTPYVIAVPVDQVAVRPLHLHKLWRDGVLYGLLKGKNAYFIEKDNALPFPSLWSVSMREQIQSRILSGAYSVMGALKDLPGCPLAAKDYIDELHINTNKQDELSQYMGSALRDPFGRRVNYLRFSLTEVCNLSCQYCLPEGYPDWLKHRARLSLDAIASVLKGFRQLGFQKVRFTGGEPTVHRNCLDAVKLARKIGFEKICMTTNGMLLKEMTPWAEAGLTHINFSLDSLRESTFKKITKSSGVEKVLSNIDAALQVGIDVKVNCVLMRTYNYNEIEELIAWALDRPLTLRFIELMPMELNKDFDKQERVSNQELIPLLEKMHMHPLGLEGMKTTAGPERLWAGAHKPGKIGFISPLSCNFCDRCNRLRVTAKGALKLCLFGNKDIPLDLSSWQSVAEGVLSGISAKPEKHGLEKRDWGNVSTLRTIGG